MAKPAETSPVLPKLSLRAIESASFVALVTAILYFMGYSYYAGFFARISLPPPFPELSTTDYFLQAFSSLAGLVAAALVSIPYRSIVPTTIWQALWVNSAFIIVPLILGQNARSKGFLDQNLTLVFGAVVAVSVIASGLKLSIMKDLTSRWGLAGALAYAFGIFMFFSLFPPGRGRGGHEIYRGAIATEFQHRPADLRCSIAGQRGPSPGGAGQRRRFLPRATRDSRAGGAHCLLRAGN